MKPGKHLISRRSLLKRGAATAALLAFTRSSARSYAQIIGANSEVRLAVIGCNDCGRAHIRQFIPIPGVRLVTLCDVDTAVLDRAKGITAAASPSSSPTLEIDCRKVLDNKEIDAISIATPNHWHALLTVWACMAGEDVYVEKPTCHNIWEGQQALAARTKFNRIVQAGTQWRSMPAVQQAIQWTAAGNIGKI